jgi:large subunit ribosomal protein L25
MSSLVLEAQPRDITGETPKSLRRRGLVPVIVYGRGQEPVALIVEERNLEYTLRHGGSSQLIKVQVAGGKDHNVLVREVQREPIHHHPLHADMYAVRMDEKQHVSVPLVGKGKPTALASGLMVLQNHEMIAIEALPADIPAEVVVDLTELSPDHPIRSVDLPKVRGVAYMVEPDEHIFVMVTTQAGLEEEAEATGEEVTAEPEVVRKGKTEEGEE